jgi:uncharacterized membrane protein YqgA involved in biofilm formation
VIATFVNCAAVIVGSLLGLLFRRTMKDNLKSIIYVGAGLTSLIIGIKMSLSATRIVFLAFSLILGGILGTWWKVEGGILNLGELLRRTFAKKETGTSFASGFLNASVLFCVGAMTLIGSFRAGTEGNYELLFTKSVMDGFMAIVLTAAMGIGVAFSAVTILVYQGGLTLAAGLLKPLVSDLMLSELTGVGGALVIVIGINLLGLKEIKTANLLPALLVMVLLVALESPVLRLLGM